MHYTPDEDGLSLPWRGTVFVNPPYGRAVSAWTEKARGEVEAARATTVVALLPARTDTKWWHQSVAGIADVFLLRGRLKFGGEAVSAPFPSAVVVWGANTTTCAELIEAMPDAWYIAKVT